MFSTLNIHSNKNVIIQKKVFPLGTQEYVWGLLINLQESFKRKLLNNGSSLTSKSKVIKIITNSLSDENHYWFIF